ncbi:hypothetical protein GQ457_17G002460 [Hibiscus cannabinus]
MKSFLPFFAFLSLLLLAGTIAAAKKDAGEYWRAVTKDQPMPEALRGLVRVEAASAGSNGKAHCDTPAGFELKEEKIIVEDFGHRGTEKKSAFADDFEPRPNVSAYGDDENLKLMAMTLKGKKSSSSFAEDFEPRPNISAYGDDVKLKGKAKSFTGDFEQEPNVSVYHD